jgi:hypothetical protein
MATTGTVPDKTSTDVQYQSNYKGDTIDQSSFKVKEGTRIITSQDNEKEKKNNEHTICGFLLSYSKLPQGEYWVLREGRNIIGKDNDCNIPLKEEHVSKSHAILNIRRSGNDGRLMFIISDQNSSNGIFVNNKDIELQSYELSNGDIIKIGNYELLLISIDKNIKNLSLNKDFKPIQEVSNLYASY